MQDVPRAWDIVKSWDVSPHVMSTLYWAKDAKKNNKTIKVGLMVVDPTQLTIEGVATTNRSIIKTIIMMMTMNQHHHHPWYKWMDRR